MSLPGALGRVEPDASARRRLASPLSSLVGDPSPVLTPVDVDYPAACLDGRPFDVATVDLPHVHRPTDVGGPPRSRRTPRVAGGTLTTWTTDLLATGLFRPQVSRAQDRPRVPDDMDLIPPGRIGEELQTWTPAWLSLTCSAMRTAGLPVSTHTDEGARPPDSGCGAADNLRTILALIGQRPGGIADLLTRWGIDPSDVPDTVVQRCCSFSLTLPDGEDLAGVIAGYADSPLPVMRGAHREVAVLANTVPGTTVDPSAVDLGAGRGADQVFVVDTWAFGRVADFLLGAGPGRGARVPLSREQVVATAAAVNAATLLTLCAASMPVAVLGR